MYSQPCKPRPGRKRHHLGLRTTSILLIVVFVTTFLTTALAHGIEVPYEEYDSSLFRRFAQRGEIAIDRRDPPPRPTILQRQDNADPFGSTAAPLATPTSESEASAAAASSTDVDSTITIQSTVVATPTNTITETANATSTSNSTESIETATSSTSAPSPLPSAFDTSLGSNFTAQACPSFFSSFLNNATFIDCHPTSLLLQNSNSFFRASRSPVLLSQALDASCGAPLAQCSPLMASLASQLVQDSNCGQDHRNENPIVIQAQAGLISYEPLYRATCLKNEATGNYCFADAITNTSNPSDSYPYYTALGTNLPAASRPTCDKCLEDVMGIFAGYAANRDQPVSRTFTMTAQQINLGCGPEFVNATVPVATVSNAAVRHGIVTAALMAFVVVLVVTCLPF